MSEVDRLGVIARWKIQVCPTCRRFKGAAICSGSAAEPHQKAKTLWVDVVRDTDYRGAVEDLEALRAVLSPVSAFVSDGARVNRAREMVADLLTRLGGQ
jgi:hypothetical protein